MTTIAAAAQESTPIANYMFGIISLVFVVLYAGFLLALPLVWAIKDVRGAKRDVHKQRHRKVQMRADSHKIQHHPGYSRRLEPGNRRVVYPSAYERVREDPRDFSPVFCVVAPRNGGFGVTMVRRDAVAPPGTIDEFHDPSTYPTTNAAVSRAVGLMGALMGQSPCASPEQQGLASQRRGVGHG